MPIAFSTLACPQWSLAQAMQFAKAQSYQGIEIRGYKGSVLPAEISDQEVADIVYAQESTGITVVALGSSVRLVNPGLDQELSTARKFIKLAKRVGARFVRVYGGPIPESVSEGQAIERVGKGLKALAPEAEREGVQVLIETHDDFSYSYRVKQAVEVADSPAIGVIWDVLHPLRHKETVEQTWEQIGPYVRHVHIKDGIPHEGIDWNLVPLDTGKVPIGRILELLSAGEYKDWLCVEWEWLWHKDLSPAEEALPHELRALSDVAKRLQISIT